MLNKSSMSSNVPIIVFTLLKKEKMKLLFKGLSTYWAQRQGTKYTPCHVFAEHMVVYFIGHIVEQSMYSWGIWPCTLLDA